MKVYQVEFDCFDDSPKISRERMYMTGCWITIAEWSIRHAEEFDKELVSIADVLTVTIQLDRDKTYHEHC